MRLLLAVILGVFNALTATSATPEAPSTPSSAPPREGEDPLETEFRRLLESDDAAQNEVDQWIRAEEQFRAAGGGVSDATLRARVMQRLQSVRQAYADFVFLHPKHVPARIAFGSFLNDLEDGPGAQEQWEQARDLEPNNPAIWNNLANLHGHDGPISKAFEYYEKAISLDSKEATYYRNLATTVYLFRKDAMEYFKCDEPAVFERSLGLYRKAISLQPDDFVLASDYAMSFYGIKPSQSLSSEARREAQDKLNQEAIKAWEEALKIASDDLQRQGVLIHLARVKINDGQFENARAHLESVTNSIYLETRNTLSRNLADKEQRKSPLP